MATIEEFAPAKINLTLHVTGQRADGYHLLDSLVVFADIGDHIRAEPGAGLTLSLTGPEAPGLTDTSDNLVLRAARLLSPDRGAALTLTKRLPVASGIGGGSTDAAATLRALSRLWSLPLPGMDQLLKLGADLPVCLTPRPRRMSGIGEVLQPVPQLPEMDILLVNPRRSVPTPSVFRALRSKSNPPMPAQLPAWHSLPDFTAWLAAQRNDLHPPAAALAPEIPEVLTALTATGALHSGMSGSGATCFALFPPTMAEPALKHIRATHPNWWSAAGRIL